MDYTKKFNLRNKKVYVLGGSGLIGSQICLAVSQFGGHVINLDKQTNKNLKKKNIKNIVYDLKNIKRYKKDLLQIFKENGNPDVFINASYIFTKDWRNCSFEDIELKTIQENINLQLTSSLWLSKIFAETMRKNKIKGNLVFLGSIYGLVAQDEELYRNTNIKINSIYPAIKGALINFTKQIASYYGKYNIRANVITPGGLKGSVAGYSNKQSNKFIQQYSKKTFLKRMGCASEIAPAVIFLISDAGSYVTGSNLIIDGGWTSH